MTHDPDSPRLTPERRDLADRHVAFAMDLARPFCRSWPHLAGDFRGEAGLALSESAKAWDESRGVKFATFAGHRIVGACRDVQRKALLLGQRQTPKDRRRYERSFDSIRDDGFRFLGMEPNDPVGTGLEAADEVESLLRKLPRRHAEVCRHLYLRGMTQQEAAHAMGITQSCISVAYREAIAIIDGSWRSTVLAEIA